jgi:hypothetical protein
MGGDSLISSALQTPGRRLPPSVKKGESGLDVPAGIIGYLTKQCRGNVP